MIGRGMDDDLVNNMLCNGNAVGEGGIPAVALGAALPEGSAAAPLPAWHAQYGAESQRRRRLRLRLIVDLSDHCSPYKRDPRATVSCLSLSKHLALWL